MKRILLFLLLLATASCSSNNPGKIVIGVSQCSDDQWRDRLNKELQTEAFFYDNVEVKILSANDDNDKQISDIKSLVKSGIDLLVVMPNEAAPITAIVEEVYNSGTPVIVVDRKILSDKYTAFVGADNYQIGKDIGQYLSKTQERKYNIVELTGLSGSSPAMERHLGFLSGISSDKDAHLLCSTDACWQKDSAYARMSSILSEHSNIDVVFSHNDRMAQGAYEAAKEAGREKDIKFIGVDALPGVNGGIDLVKNGILFATFIYPTGGDVVIDVAMSILSGQPYARENNLQSGIVDKSNARVLALQTDQIINHENKIQRLNYQLEKSLMEYSTQKKLLFGSLVLILLILVLVTILLLIVRSKSSINKDLIEQRDRVLKLSKQVEEATAAKLLFFTNISHELRTPLTLISDPLDKLIKEKDMSKEDSKQLLLLVKKNVDILLQLINQILDFRKLENGKMTMKYENVDLLELIKNCNQAFTAAFKSKHLTFDFTWDEDCDYKVSTDAKKISSIYYNIISNAFKYTPVGGTIAVNMSISGGRLDMSIHNTGSYIEPSRLKHIFDRFYRVDDNYSGSGIGLSIVNAYVQLLGGRVSAKSSKEEGTVFSFFVPVRPADGELRENISDLVPGTVGMTDYSYKDTISEAGYNSNGRYLLVIDDNRSICDYLAYLFKDSFSVIVARNGRDGVDKAVKYIPDIIISDVMMPGDMDGLKCCSMIKDNPLTCHIPVILLTALTLDEQKAQGYECGADSYLTKPFNSDVLISRVNNLIQGRERLHEIFDSSSLPQSKVEIVDMDRDYIEKLIRFIEAHLSSSDLSIDDLCKEMASSRTQLFRKVKMLTGWTPAEYLRIIRLNKAKKLLQVTNYTAAEIGYMTGFSSPSYFAKCYKDYFGVNPTSERQ